MASTERGGAAIMKPAAVTPFARQTAAFAPSAADSSSTLSNYVASVGAATTAYGSPSTTSGMEGRDPRADLGLVFFTNPALTALSVANVAGTRYFVMIGKSNLTGTWASPWVVTGAPDTTGAQYPGPGTVDATTIRILNDWQT